MELTLLYLIGVLLAAYYGRRLATGFWGSFLLALLITPVLYLLFAAMFRPREKATSKSA
jgi:uncharacterized membrane protein YhdT